MTVNGSSHHKSRPKLFSQHFDFCVLQCAQTDMEWRVRHETSILYAQNFPFHAIICTESPSTLLTPLISLIPVQKTVILPFHPRNKCKKISLSSLAAKYARIYEYQKPSQISKITVRRHLLFKCHCNEIYFVFFQSHCFFDISTTDKIQCPVTYHLLVPFENVS